MPLGRWRGNPALQESAALRAELKEAKRTKRVQDEAEDEAAKPKTTGSLCVSDAVRSAALAS
jgi:hypothetical protein